jgi:hypothetical protein
VTTKIVAGLLAAAALAGCETGPTVRTDIDPNADLSGFRTFTWIYQAAPRGMNPLLYERVRNSIDRSLTARGFRQADPGDFAVAFTIGSRDRVQVTDFGPYGPGFSRWGYGWGRGGWGGSWGRNTEVRTFTEGSLVIDIYDVRTKMPVWHGLATQEIGSNVSQATIDRGVDAVIARFPGGQPTPATRPAA